MSNKVLHLKKKKKKNSTSTPNKTLTIWRTHPWIISLYPLKQFPEQGCHTHHNNKCCKTVACFWGRGVVHGDIGWTVVKFQQPFPTPVSVLIKLCYCLSVTLVHAQNQQAVMLLCCKCAKGQVKVWNVAEFEAETCYTISVSTNLRHSQKSLFTYSKQPTQGEKAPQTDLIYSYDEPQTTCALHTVFECLQELNTSVTFTHTWHRLLHRKHSSCCRTNSSAFASQHTTHRNLGTKNNCVLWRGGSGQMGSEMWSQGTGVGCHEPATLPKDNSSSLTSEVMTGCTKTSARLLAGLGSQSTNRDKLVNKYF